MRNEFAAVWIDHDHACLVRMDESGKPTSTKIESLVEPRHRTTGQSGVPLPGHLRGNTEDRDRNRRTLQLNRFYERVMKEIPPDARIVLLGPGMAKGEFLRQMERRPQVARRIARVVTTGKLSLPQIAALLREIVKTQDVPAAAGSINL